MRMDGFEALGILRGGTSPGVRHWLRLIRPNTVQQFSWNGLTRSATGNMIVNWQCDGAKCSVCMHSEFQASIVNSRIPAMSQQLQNKQLNGLHGFAHARRRMAIWLQREMRWLNIREREQCPENGWQTKLFSPWFDLTGSVPGTLVCLVDILCVLHEGFWRTHLVAWAPSGNRPKGKSYSPGVQTPCSQWSLHLNFWTISWFVMETLVSFERNLWL